MEPMEKRNVVEDGRTPPDTAKMAEVVDEAVEQFDPNALLKEADGQQPPAKAGGLPAADAPASGHID